MSEIEEKMTRAYESSPDRKTRKRMLLFASLAVLFALTTLAVTWSAYFRAKDQSQTLAQQIRLACASGEWGDGFSEEDIKALCDNAEKVIDNSGEIQDDEIQEREEQEREIQEREEQEREIQERERQQNEVDNPEVQDQDPDSPDPVDDPDPDSPDPVDDPDPDDPDPNDQITGVTCTFTGTGTIVITVQTDNGPVTSECVGTGTPPGQLERATQ